MKKEFIMLKSKAFKDLLSDNSAVFSVSFIIV